MARPPFERRSSRRARDLSGRDRSGPPRPGRQRSAARAVPRHGLPRAGPGPHGRAVAAGGSTAGRWTSEATATPRIPPTDIGEWDRLGADALAVADALGLQRAIGFGHSMGGTALLMAERERPGTFAGLVLFEPIAFPHDQSRSEGPPALAALTRRRRSVFESRDEAYDNYASKPPLSAFDTRVTAGLRRPRPHRPPGRRGRTALRSRARGPDLRGGHELGHVRAPGRNRLPGPRARRLPRGEPTRHDRPCDRRSAPARARRACCRSCPTSGPCRTRCWWPASWLDFVDALPVDR